MSNETNAGMVFAGPRIEDEIKRNMPSLEECRAARQTVDGENPRVRRLEDTLDLMRDEFRRIRALFWDRNLEVNGICDRAIAGIEQHAPVVVQRDRAESRARDMESTYQFGALVMNKLVLPRIPEGGKAGTAFEFLEGWLKERDEAKAILQEIAGIVGHGEDSSVSLQGMVAGIRQAALDCQALLRDCAEALRLAQNFRDAAVAYFGDTGLYQGAYAWQKLAAYDDKAAALLARLSPESPEEVTETDASIGRRWREDSSLEKWFPFTAELLRDCAEALRPFAWHAGHNHAKDYGDHAILIAGYSDKHGEVSITEGHCRRAAALLERLEERK